MTSCPAKDDLSRTASTLPFSLAASCSGMSRLFGEQNQPGKQHTKRPAFISSLLRAIGGKSFGEAMSKSYHAGRAIGWIEQYIHDMQAAGIGQCGGESSLELPLGLSLIHI